MEPRTPDEELIQADEPRMHSVLDDASRVDRMGQEITRGFAALHDLGPAAAVFGSARTPPDAPGYRLGVDVGRRLGEAGLSVITGGGPGIMEAANRGAKDAGARSVGLTIDLPMEEGVNPYVDLRVHFHYFFCRKIMFVRYACAFVALPGGMGTLDELFECLTLIQTGKVRDFPVVLVGTAYWGGLLTWLQEGPCADGKIDPSDIERMQITDDLDEVLQIVRAAAARHYG